MLGVRKLEDVRVGVYEAESVSMDLYGCKCWASV